MKVSPIGKIGLRLHVGDTVSALVVTVLALSCSAEVVHDGRVVLSGKFSSLPHLLEIGISVVTAPGVVLVSDARSSLHCFVRKSLGGIGAWASLPRSHVINC